MESSLRKFDLCVIGGGSGGFGAALAAARSGLKVALIEKMNMLGGNAVHGGVNNWESGIGGTAFPYEIYKRLKQIPLAVGISKQSRHLCWDGPENQNFPGGELTLDPDRSYEDTLIRHGTKGIIKDAEKVKELWNSMTFEPDAMAKIQYDLLQESGNCECFFNTTYTGVKHDSGKVHSIYLESDLGEIELVANYFVDSSAGVHLCKDLGCEIMQGKEPYSAFEEQHAPKYAKSHSVNAVSLIYRVSQEGTLSKISGSPPDCWFASKWPIAVIFNYPNGDKNINMLPTMEGRELMRYLEDGTNGYKEAYEECKKRASAHWEYLRARYDEFRPFKISWIAPSLGVRETQRVVGDYILTEHDLLAGLSSQTHEDIIAIADHSMDSHGEDSRGAIELEAPYGIPYRCLIPKGFSNLLVACRGASFSHVAASSCRLSRTMMDLGHAAGLGIALAARDNSDVRDIDVTQLREKLTSQGATLNSEE